MAALSDSASSLWLLCLRLRTSSSRAALSAFSWVEEQWSAPFPEAAPNSPVRLSPHLLQVLLEPPEHGLKVRDLF